MPVTMNPEKNSLRLIQLVPPYLLAASAFIALLSFIWLGQYAHPSADDFCMATGIQHEGLLPHLWNHYFEWSGRYSGNALYALYPVIFGMFDGLKFMPAVLILLLFIACAYLLAKIYRVRMTAKPVMLVSLCLVSVFLLGMKHTASSLYWPSGALSYQTANILFLFTLGLIIRIMERQRRFESYSFNLVTLIFVIILGIGTNETTMLAIIAILSLAVIFHLRSGWRILKPWLVVMSIASLCFAIVYFAPGNAIRESTFPLRHDLPRVIKGSLDMGSWVLLGWLLNPLFIVASLLTPFAVSQLHSSSPRSFTISRFQLVAIIIVTFTVPFILQFPAWWAMGGWPPPRTVDAIFFVFIMSWFFMLAALTVRLAPQTFVMSMGKHYSAPYAITLMVGSILFVLAIYGSFTFQRSQLDLWQRAEAFHQYMLHRYALINEAVSSQQHSLQVPAFNREYPRSIYFNDIVPDSRDWRNVCYADYFGLQEISRERQLKKTKHRMKRLRRPGNSYNSQIK